MINKLTIMIIIFSIAELKIITTFAKLFIKVL